GSNGGAAALAGRSTEKSQQERWRAGLRTQIWLEIQDEATWSTGADCCGRPGKQLYPFARRYLGQIFGLLD
ncbi:MAG TPA: hypothetical protein VLA11_00480, partial [Woeseiaceae bacterium]|nr:hypothetical protein [Woeseiaceae bacterium]